MNMFAKQFPSAQYVNGAGAAGQWEDFKAIVQGAFEAARKRGKQVKFEEEESEKKKTKKKGDTPPPLFESDEQKIADRVSTQHFDYLAALSEAASSLSHIHRLLELDVLYAKNTGDHVGRAIEMVHSCPGGLRDMLKVVTTSVCGSWRALSDLVLNDAEEQAEQDLGLCAMDCLELLTDILVLCVKVYEEKECANSANSDAAFIVKEEVLKFG